MTGYNQLQQMSHLPSRETILQVKDVKNLQDACLKLVSVCEKAADSKIKYRNCAANLQKELQEKEFELTTLREKNATLEAITREMMANPSSEANEEMKKELEKRNKEIGNMKEEISLYKSKMADTQNSIVTLTQEQESLISKIRTLEGQLSDQTILIQNLEAQKESSTRTLRLMEEELNKGTNDQNAIVGHIQKEKEELAKRVGEMETELGRLKLENEQMEERAAKGDQLAAVLAQVAKLTEEGEQLRKENKHLTEKVEEMDKEQQTMLHAKEELTLKYSELSSKIEQAEQTIQEQARTIQQRDEDQKNLIQILESNKTKAKERIKKLQLANISANEESAKNTERQEEEKKQLEKEIESLKEEINGITENHKSELDSLIAKNLEIQQKCEELKQDNEQKTNQVEDIQREHQFMLKVMTEKDARLSEMEELKKEREENNKIVEGLKLEILNEKNATLESERERATLADEIKEKDSNIVKLKTLLSRAVKSDQRKQQQLDEIQNERTELLSQLSSFSISEVHDEQDASVISDLEQELRDLSTKNTKLQDMLDSSTRLYNDLKDAYRHLEKQLETNSRTYRLGTETFEIFDRTEDKSATRHTKKMSNTAKKEAKLVKSAYLRRVVLQFFSQEGDSERGHMVPMILELVGCTKEQISMVMRQWERNQHLIYRTAGFFKFK